MPSIEEQAALILAALPASVRTRAESLRQAGERERWQCGQDAADMIDELCSTADVPGSYSRAGVRRALAILYHCTDDTVRDREWVWRRCPAALRDAYPALTYHYWRACAQAGTTQGTLTMAMQITEHYQAWGSLPSVSTVYGWLYQDELALPVWMSRLRGVLAQLEKIKNDPLLPSEIAGVIDEIVQLLRVTSA